MINTLKKGTGEKGWIVLVHGLGEHIGRYEKLVNVLSDLGFGVIGFDLPGHGNSAGKRGHTSIEESIEIINKLTEGIEKFHIFGHSLGGLIAVRYAQENMDRIKTLVISSPALYVKPSMVQLILLNMMKYIFPSLTVSNGIDPKLLSRNNEAVRKYIEDELVHNKVSVKLGKSLLDNVRIAHEKVKLITVPTMILIGTSDKVTPPIGAYSFYENLLLNDKDKKLVKFEGAYHEIFEDPEHHMNFYKTIFEWYESRG
ncbi:MAG: alpha/beta hydrolase [Thermosipho sp. (in: Bacteria)]|nr:alpha/beta hydrolase [Thermosipho sp. (in: thermotogales)]